MEDADSLTDTINYTAHDSGANSSSANLVVTIDGTVRPVAVADAASVTEDAVPNTATGNRLRHSFPTRRSSDLVLHVSAASGTGATTANGDGSFDVVGAHGTLHIAGNGS